MNALPRISKLSNLVWRVLGCNPGPMTLQGSNVYLVGNGLKRILVDAGQNGFPEYVQNLCGLLKEENVTVDQIVITHWHQDHVGGLLDLFQPLFQKRSLPATVYKFPRTDISNEPSPEGYNLQRLADNQKIETAGATLRILFTPGHTTDHAALILEEESAVFSGDCILGEGTTVFEDLYDYMLSLEKIMAQNPKLIYPGHGPVVEDPKEKIQYYLNHRRQREEQIYQVLKDAVGKELTSGQIVKVVYKDTPVHLHPAAELNVNHHLDKLVKEKRVRRKANTFFVDEFESGKL